MKRDKLRYLDNFKAKQARTNCILFDPTENNKRTSYSHIQEKNAKNHSHTYEILLQNLPQDSSNQHKIQFLVFSKV